MKSQAAGSMDLPMAEKASLRCRLDPQSILTRYPEGLFLKPEGRASKTPADGLAPINGEEIHSHYLKTLIFMHISWTIMARLSRFCCNS